MPVGKGEYFCDNEDILKPSNTQSSILTRTAWGIPCSDTISTFFLHDDDASTDDTWLWALAKFVSLQFKYLTHVKQQYEQLR